MPKVRTTKSYAFFRYIIAGSGWLIIFYEWVRVSHQAPGRDELTLILVLIPSLFLIHAGASVWIGHSRRLAARGKRGLVTRYTSPVFSHDHLGRQLLFDEGSIGSKEVIVSIDGNTKSYAPAAETLLLSKGADTSIDREAKSYAPANEVWR
jgi:hypothetical protein